MSENENENENEKRLKSTLEAYAGRTALDFLDALLVETRQSARDAALEEAALVAFNGTCERCGKPITLESGAWWHVPPHDNQSDHFAGPGKHRCGTAGHIRALKSQPARRYLDAEEVRKALTGHGDMWTCADAARALGLDLDAPFTAPLGCCPLYGTDHDTCRHDAAASQPTRRYLDAEHAAEGRKP